MKKIFLIIAIFFSNKIFAQNTNLTNNASYGQRYQEQLENNTAKPNAPLYNGFNSSNSGVSTPMLGKAYWDKVYERQLQSRLAQIPGYMEKLKQQQEKLEKDTKEADKQKSIVTEQKQNRDEQRSYFYNRVQRICPSLDSREAERIARFCVAKDGSITDDYVTYMMMSVNASKFEQTVNSASFIELISLIREYEILPITAIKHLNILLAKFPDQKDIINITIMEVLPNYYNHFSISEDIYSGTFAGDPKIDEEYKELFFKLLKDYPSEMNSFYPLYSGDNNPYVYDILSSFKKEDFIKGRKNRAAFDKITNFYKIPNKLITSITYRNYQNIYNVFEWYRGQLQLEEIKNLATIHGLDAFKLITNYMDYDFNRWKGYYRYGKMSDCYLSKSQLDYIKQLAEEGNANAQNFYALRIALGYQKSNKKTDAIEWFKKASAGGNTDADDNLKTLCRNSYYTVKGFEEFCK